MSDSVSLCQKKCWGKTKATSVHTHLAVEGGLERVAFLPQSAAIEVDTDKGPFCGEK